MRDVSPLSAVLWTLVAFTGSVSAQTLTLSQRNTQSLGSGQAVGQLSGLTHLGGNNWYVVSDKRNEILPLNINFNPIDGSTTIITQSAKLSIAGAERDYEGIAFTGATRNSLLISEEDSPAVREFDFATLTERANSPLITPAVFLPPNLRGNLGFESLTYHAGTGDVFTANEEALVNDGPVSSPTQSTKVRIQKFTPSGNTFVPNGQWAYQVDQVHGSNAGITDPSPQSGLSDLVALEDGRLLALERSVFYTNFFGQPLPDFQSRIYLINPTGSPANADLNSPLSKTLLWSGSLGLSGNLEGLALGPATASGRLGLGVVDNADNPLLVGNLTAFELTEVPEPSSLSAIIISMTALLQRVRRLI